MAHVSNASPNTTSQGRPPFRSGDLALTFGFYRHTIGKKEKTFEEAVGYGVKKRSFLKTEAKP